MSEQRRPRPGVDCSLATAIAAALALKVVALTALYLAFFQPPLDSATPAERAATALGLK